MNQDPLVLQSFQGDRMVLVLPVLPGVPSVLLHRCDLGLLRVLEVLFLLLIPAVLLDQVFLVLQDFQFLLVVLKRTNILQ